jgi:hypothetical protein
VIGVPEAFSSSRAPFLLCARSRHASQSLDVIELSDAIETAEGADSMIALEYALAEVTRVAPQLPFFNAPSGTKGLPARRNFQLAPAAKAAAVRSFG